LQGDLDARAIVIVRSVEAPDRRGIIGHGDGNGLSGRQDDGARLPRQVASERRDGDRGDRAYEGAVAGVGDLEEAVVGFVEVLVDPVREWVAV
jgi:hypothetical protein